MGLLSALVVLCLGMGISGIILATRFSMPTGAAWSTPDATLLITLVPSILVEAIAGLALLGSFSAAVYAALSDLECKEAAAITFLFAGSGLAFLGVGGAFLGLLIGCCMYFLTSKKGLIHE